MTSPSQALPSQCQPLHFLASVISAMGSEAYRHSTPESSAGPSSSSDRSCPSPPAPVFLPHVASLHIPCKRSNSPAPIACVPLKRSSSSNHPSPINASFVPFIRHKTTRRSRKTSELHLKARMQMKLKRKELLEKATRIKSLDNSPVNERQLLVLCMVYDEITMYPCESWMVLIAIVIHRAYKQVKNWFSNERQKNRTGESVPFETDDGDRVRLRSSALAICNEWSDSFFEEVIMIYNFRALRQSRYDAPPRLENDST